MQKIVKNVELNNVTEIGAYAFFDAKSLNTVSYVSIIFLESFLEVT